MYLILSRPSVSMGMQAQGGMPTNIRKVCQKRNEKVFYKTRKVCRIFIILMIITLFQVIGTGGLTSVKTIAELFMYI